MKTICADTLATLLTALGACAEQLAAPAPTEGPCTLDSMYHDQVESRHPIQSGGEARRSQWDAAIHDYLLTHGDVVLQCRQDNQKRQLAARMDALQPVLLANPTDPVAGDPGATVAVVEFFDRSCFMDKMCS